MRWLFLVVALALPYLALADEGPAEATVSTSNVSAATSKLSPGWKHIVCDTSTHMRTGGSSVAATTSDLSIVGWDLYIGGNELYIAFILNSSTGSCTVHKLTPGPTGVPPSHAANGDITPTSVTTGVISASVVSAVSLLLTGNVLSTGGMQMRGPIFLTDGDGNPVMSATGASASFILTGIDDTDVTIKAAGAGIMNVDAAGEVDIGTTTATSVVVGRTGQGVFVNGTVTFNGASSFTKYITGTVAVTGGAITAGNCANQGTAITETGAAAGDACFLGLSASPGNGLAYSCVTSSNSCQIVACNASAGNLTSLTGTHRCTVIH